MAATVTTIEVVMEYYLTHPKLILWVNNNHPISIILVPVVLNSLQLIAHFVIQVLIYSLLISNLTCVCGAGNG